MNNKKSKVIKTAAAAAAGLFVAGVLCSCAPLYGKVGEMMESAAGLGREKVAETREERNVGQWPFGETRETAITMPMIPQIKPAVAIPLWSAGSMRLALFPRVSAIMPRMRPASGTKTPIAMAMIPQTRLPVAVPFAGELAWYACGGTCPYCCGGMLSVTALAAPQ